MIKPIQTTLAGIVLLLALLVPGPAQAKGVILNFTDVDIATMVKFISDLTGKNFVMDERVKGKISVYSPAKLSSEEAFNVFTSVLELKGFTLIQVGKVYKIVPLAAAKQSGTRIYSDYEKGPVNDSYVARVVTLDNISAQDALTFLQPTVSKDGSLSAFGPANMLLVVDSSLNIQKILDILKVIDTEKQRDSAEIIYLKNAGAENVAKVLQDWLGNKSQKAAGQQGQSSFGASVVADSRLNALFVFAGEKDKEEIRKFVSLIDVAPPTSSNKVNVYSLENADATEVAKVLDGVVKGSAATQGQQAQGGAPPQSPFDAGKITITPDKATNSLIIMASPIDYQNLLQVIQKLDKRRRQVFVEAIIAEVSLNRLRDLGVQWGILGGASDGKNVSTFGQYDPNSVFTTLFTALSALKTVSGTSGMPIPDTAITPANFAVMLQALETNGITNILSTPTILTSDNKEAEIFVGENVPFLSSTNLSSTGLSQQSVERKDTGITLKITPQISEGEYVKLDIYQEISAVKDATSKGAATDIITTKRSAKTAVVVKDMETVVIGGLIQDQDEETISKIPLLGDIPLLGWFFKSKGTTRKKTNLMIFLTPRVIKGPNDLLGVAARQREKFVGAVNNQKPLDVNEELTPKP